MYFILLCKEIIVSPVLSNCNSTEQCFFGSDNFFFFFPCECLIWGCGLTSFTVSGTSTSHAVHCTFYMVFCFHKKLMNASIWDSLEMVYLMRCFCSRYSTSAKLLLLQSSQLFLSDTRGSTGKDMKYMSFSSAKMAAVNLNSYLFFALAFNRKTGSKIWVVAAPSLRDEWGMKRTSVLGTLLNRHFCVFPCKQESKPGLTLSEGHDDFPNKCTGSALAGNKGRRWLSLILNLSARIIVKGVLAWLRRSRPRLFNWLILEMR